jgi:SpoVK/Ycf46/Vps4 family AAA+-type ATPase
MSAMNQNDFQELSRAVSGVAPCITICTYEEDAAVELCRQVAMEHGRAMWLWSVASGIQDGLMAGGLPVENTNEPSQALGHFGTIAGKPVCVLLDLAAHLGEAPILRVLRNLLRHCESKGSKLVLIDHASELPEVIKAHSVQIDLSLPDDNEIEATVRSTLREAHRENPIDVNISKREWATVLRNLRGLSRREIRRIVHECVAEDRTFDDQDLNHILASKRKSLSGGGLLEFVETPVELDSIGGLRRLKQWLAQREHSFDPQARDFGVAAPRGVLMLGIQGAGKSLCAKAIATAWQRPLLRMDVGALYDKYVGESERRLRDALRQAEMMAPIVLWIDEIEKAFAAAASQSNDGGLSKRMFGCLLTWMQEHNYPVFLVATANDIEALPPELMRKGRFDEIFFVDLPREDVRRQIFEIHLRKRKRNPQSYELDQLATQTDGFSGAEIEQAVMAGLHKAFAEKRQLTTEDLLEIVRNSPPLSVTMAEKVAGLRRWALDRCVPAD